MSLWKLSLAAAATLLASLALTGGAPGSSRQEVPWSCAAIEKPVLDRSASRGAEPMPYDYPGWIRHLTDYGQEHPRVWADLYLDHSPEGENDPIFIHVLLTRNVDRHARAIRRLSKEPESLLFSKAAVTIRDLEETSKRISREQFRDEPSPDFGVELVATSVDTPDNLLRIYLRKYKASAAEALHDRYGPRTCVSLRDTKPGFPRAP